MLKVAGMISSSATVADRWRARARTRRLSVLTQSNHEAIDIRMSALVVSDSMAAGLPAGSMTPLSGRCLHHTASAFVSG